MKLTNKSGLDKRWVKMAEKLYNTHPKFGNDKFSVTELLKSEKQIALRRIHDDEIEVDIQRVFPILIGTACHEALAEVTQEDEELKEEWIAEDRLEMELTPGITISGGFDALEKTTWELHDQKFTKLPKIELSAKGEDDEWFRQLTLYSILIENKFGRKPLVGYITAGAKDHSYLRYRSKKKECAKSGKDIDYPEYPIRILKFELNDPIKSKMVWEEAKDKALRVKDILDGNIEPAPCTFGEMWCKEDWAIMKPNSQRAYRAFFSETDALEFYTKLAKKDEYKIYHRVSEPNNCACFCPCVQFCEQGKKALDMEPICEDVTDEILPF